MTDGAIGAEKDSQGIDVVEITAPGSRGSVEDFDFEVEPSQRECRYKTDSTGCIENSLANLADYPLPFSGTITRQKSVQPRVDSKLADIFHGLRDDYRVAVAADAFP